jgi:hypothetical protein
MDVWRSDDDIDVWRSDEAVDVRRSDKLQIVDVVLQLKTCVQQLFASNIYLNPAYCEDVFFLSSSRKYCGSASTILRLHTSEFPLLNP